jgi:hypothetical protein
VGTSESGAQPPVGRTKIFSEGSKWTWTFANFFLHWTFWPGCPPSASENTTLKHACFDVVYGVTSEETRLVNFFSRTFFRDLATRHPARDTWRWKQKPRPDPVWSSPPAVIIPALLSQIRQSEKQNCRIPATKRKRRLSSSSTRRKPSSHPANQPTRPDTPALHPLYPYTPPTTNEPTQYNTIYYILSFNMK